MEETSMPRRGPIEGTSRVVRELLRTPRFKKTVNILLSELDPENTGLLVRTLVWEDPEFFLSLLGAAPDIANMGIVGLLELTRQMANFPHGLLASFLAEVLAALDGKQLGEAVGNIAVLASRVSESGGEAVGQATSQFAAGFRKGIEGTLSEAGAGGGAAGFLAERVLPALGTAAAKLGEEAAREGSQTRAALKKVTDGIRDIASENPDFMKEVVAPLVEAGRQALAGTDAGEGS